MKHYLLDHSRNHKYMLLFSDAIFVGIGILLNYSLRIYINEGGYSSWMLLDKFN